MANRLVTELVLNDKNFGQGIQTAKARLGEFNGVGNNATSTLSSFASSLGINISTIASYATTIGIATSALDLLKDALLSSEENIDEWGRTIQGAKNAYDTFVQNIGRGDFDNLIEKIEEAYQKGRNLYNLFDALGSVRVNNSMPIAIIERKLAELRLAGKTATKEYQDYIKELHDYKSEEVRLQKRNAMRGAIDLMTSNGVSNEDAHSFWSAYQKYGDKAFDKLRSGAIKLKGTSNAIVDNLESLLGRFALQYKQAELEEKSLVESEYRYQRFAKKGTQTQKTPTPKTSNNTSRGKIDMYDFSGIDISTLPTPNTLGWHESIIKELEKALKDPNLTSKQYVELSAKLVLAKDNLEKFKKGVSNEFGDIKIDTGNFPTFKEILDSNTKSVKGMAEGFAFASKMVEQTSSAFQGLSNDISFNIAMAIARCIGTIAIAYAETLAKDKADQTNIYQFIAAAAASTLSLASTIAGIHQATGYANGGIIQGNSKHGDHNLIGIARVNSGEMILNSKQQANLWKEINNPSNSVNTFNGGNVEFRIKGTELVGTLNNYSKKQSRL